MNLLHNLAQRGLFNDIRHPNPSGGLGDDQVASAVQVFFLLAGIISVVMVIIGGYWYVLSTGDPQKVKRAKDTILYAIIGLVISVSAWAIVGFVLGSAA